MKTKTVAYWINCKTCNGSGILPNHIDITAKYKTCHICDGNGKQLVEETEIID